jgi:hypothetical protein
VKEGVKPPLEILFKGESMNNSNSNPSEKLSRGEIVSLAMFIASAVFAGVAGLTFYATYETKGYALPLVFALLSINFAARQTVYK